MTAVQRAVAVAVPVPVREALWYSIPERFVGLVAPGQRLRVPLGRRRRIGVAVELAEEGPEGIRLRPLEDLLDLEPVVPSDLLDLCRWISEYYLAPIGEVVETVLPARQPAGARARVDLTSRGAMAPSLTPRERLVVDHLLERGKLRLLDLFEGLEAGLGELVGGDRAAVRRSLDRLLRDLEKKELLRVERESGGGGRYVNAVELSPGTVEELKERSGRSPKAWTAVEVLADAGRPMTVGDVANAAECSASVVRRLVKIGVLRQFTQVRSLELDRHLGGAGGEQEIVLREDQRLAVEALLDALDEPGFRAFLLRGVTGAGKTEVYLRAVARCLEQQGSALVLVPEIAMVPSLAQVLRRRFGERVGMLHSNLSEAERGQEWQRIRSGRVRVVVGPRSAALAPLRDLRLVVVDEEHDGAYKQDVRSPRYSGRDVALLRAQRSGAVAVLASATPSMEALGRVEAGRYRLLTLTRRAGGATLPEGEVVDLRQEPIEPRSGDVHFSERLDRGIRRTLDAGHQVILLRNRRGFSPVVLCRACGEDHRCADCGLPRTLHWRDRSLVCHYCASRIAMPRVCGSCGTAALEPVGAGTERVEEMFRQRYPDARVAVLDRDATQRVGGAARILEDFQTGRTQVLIGTQMVSKGHHFPNVALTGVLSADTYLKFPDFRAVERTHSLLTQVVGRAGRGEIPGRYIVQTFHPEHYAIRALLADDPAAYERAEMEFRRKFLYPPYTRVVMVLLRDSDEQRGEERIRELAHRLDRLREEPVRMTGPAPAPLERLRGQWRYQVLLRGPSAAELRRLVLRAGILDESWDVVVDVDPQNLL